MGIRYYINLIKTGLITIRNEGWASFSRKVKLWFLLRSMSSERKKSAVSRRNLVSRTEAAKIVFPVPSSSPELSIIIPVYNKWQYTLTCLKSVCRNTAGDYEVIVVDDNSSDETPEILAEIGNLIVLQNKTNMGFLDSCNLGALTARGKYILFLNNDAIIYEGWMLPMLEAIQKSDVGAVGAKLVFPQGALQEAGCIIWNDGTPWLYGRGDNSDKPEYNYVREVDYCSGACLTVKRDLFNAAGGFDQTFRPGYFEDADLCFSLRRMGYKTIYQPASQVLHFEGVTGGVESTGGMKKYQEINRAKFVEKWKGRLHETQFPKSEDGVFRARDRKGGRQVLVLDQTIPMYDRDSGSLRMFNMLRIMVEEGHRVTFLSDTMMKLQPYTSEMQQLGIEVIYRPYISSVISYLRNKGKYFDIVVLSRLNTAEKYFKAVKEFCSKARIIFDTVDLVFLRESRRAEVEHNTKLAKLAEDYKSKELELIKNSDLTFVVSPAEKDILINEDQSLKIEILSNIHSVAPGRNDFAGRRDVLFIGNFEHLPNIDAVNYFMKEIYPGLRSLIPDFKLYILGNRPDKQVLSYASDMVIVPGFIKDVTPYFQSCRVFICPLRYGSGVKGKINQSFSYGLPVISTSIGAEGMNVRAGEDILIADDPRSFAEKVALLYTDEALWNKISGNEVLNISRNFSIELAREKLKNIMNNIFAGAGNTNGD